MERSVKVTSAQFITSLIRSPSMPSLSVGASLFLLYSVSAYFALRFAGHDENIAFVWVAGPILAVFLIKSRVSCWLPLLGIAVLAEISTALTLGSELKTASVVALFSVFEAFALVATSHLFNEARHWTTSMRNMGIFLLATIVWPLVGAGSGSAVLVAMSEADFSESFKTWAAADVLGYIIFTPFFLSWFEPSLRREVYSHLDVEGTALTVLLALSCFVSQYASGPNAFIVFPLATLLTIRTGLFGAIVGTMTIGMVTLVMSLRGIGPIANEIGLSLGEKVQLLQLHVLAVALALFPIAAVILSQGILKKRARQKAAIAAAALDNMAQGLSMFDSQGRMITCNRKYREIYSLPDDICRQGSSVEQITAYLIDKKIDPRMAEEYKAATLRNPSSLDIELKLLDGRILKISRRALPDESVVSTHEDITIQRASAGRIEHMANHDPLTQLANRSQFRHRLRLALGNPCQPIALHTIDVDFFKEVNDTYGHPAGDAVLEAISQRLRSSVRDGDVVARLGGDEFAILQTELKTTAEATDLARRIVFELAQPVYFKGTKIDISVSIGIAALSDLESDSDTLMQRSDLALYSAKASGRSTYRLYVPDMEIRAQEKKLLERDIKTADPQKHFELFYQPVVSLKTGQVISLEALIRWHHPADGLVSPERFIPAAEESGAISAIGNWALHTACTEAMKWPRGIKVAVNVSAVQLSRPDFLDSIVSALTLSELSPQRLQVEITESALLYKTEDALLILTKLHDMNIGISIDDFGTGYSSLSYLRQFPFDTLKVDQSFIASMLDDKDSLVIVQSTLDLATKLGMTTVAEGVETVDQLNLLRAMLCTSVQGYLIGRPTPAGGVSPMLAGLSIDKDALPTVSQLAAGRQSRN